jgi:hypothetical protein
MKKWTQPAFILFIMLMIGSCSANRMVTSWKTQHLTPVIYHRVLVVAILPDEDSATRDKIETSFTAALHNLGYYNVVTSLAEFGRSGLRNLGQDETYIKLCNSGIDAVLTIALVNRTKETSRSPATARTHPNNYFYNRIFEYKTLLTEPGDRTENEQYFWETILFDLSKLEAVTAIQTVPSSKPGQLKMGNDLSRRILKTMVKEKTLKKQLPPKAF